MQNIDFTTIVFLIYLPAVITDGLTVVILTTALDAIWGLCRNGPDAGRGWTSPRAT